MTISHYELERLKDLPLFSSLGTETIRGLLNEAVVRMHPRRFTLFLQDDPAERFFVVFSGWVKLYRLSPSGAEAVIEIFGPGESFAEGAMHDTGVYPVSAEMVCDGRLLEIPTASFRRRLSADPELALNMLVSMSIRLKKFVRRTEQVQNQSAPQRVASFLLRYCPPDEASASIELPYDKLLIAGRLGMKPETFSRAIAKLRNVGTRVDRNEATVTDVAALQRFATE